MSNPLSLIEQIASEAILEQAFVWLCQKRSHYHFNGDVWHLRRWWTEKKAYIQRMLLTRQYRFRELRLIRGKERYVEWWCSMDALVLKAMAIVLGEHLKPLHIRAKHKLIFLQICRYLPYRRLHPPRTRQMKDAIG